MSLHANTHEVGIERILSLSNTNSCTTVLNCCVLWNQWMHQYKKYFEIRYFASYFINWPEFKAKIKSGLCLKIYFIELNIRWTFFVAELKLLNELPNPRTLHMSTHTHKSQLHIDVTVSHQSVRTCSAHKVACCIWNIRVHCLFDTES